MLLILAGVSLSAVFNDKGIFKRAESTVAKNSKEKAKEALEMLLADAKMIKYSEGLDENKLNEKLNEIGQIDETDNTKIIVNGYIWRIDRNNLEVKGFLGENDGIEISYTIVGNENWTKEAKNITINVTVKNNKGALDTSSIIVKKDETDITKDITINGGNFTLTTTESATYTVSAKNSEGKQSTPRTINVKAKVDTTAPTIEEATVESNGMDIKICATGHDKASNGEEQSGIDYFTYKITQTDGTKVKEGTFKIGEQATITTTIESTYTVEITATDKVGNGPSEAKTETATTYNSITIAEAKEKVNTTTLSQYIGTKIRDYNPEAGGIWRIFYYDEIGRFGTADTLYLKRASDEELKLDIPTDYEVTEKGEEMMKKMNPKWESSKYNTIDIIQETWAAYLCDPDNWKTYCAQDASFVIGCPSWEMFRAVSNQLGLSFSNNIVKVERDGYYTINELGAEHFKGKISNVKKLFGRVMSEEINMYFCSPVCAHDFSPSKAGLGYLKNSGSLSSLSSYASVVLRSCLCYREKNFIKWRKR